MNVFFFIFFSICTSELNNWEQYFESSLYETVTGELDSQTFVTITTPNNIYLNDIVATNFTNQLLRFDERKILYNILFENCYFYNFCSETRGTISYCVNPGNITIVNTCAYRCQTGSYLITASTFFSALSQISAVRYFSASESPGYDQDAMATLNVNAKKVLTTNLNFSSASSVAIGFQITKWGTFSYSNFVNHITQYDKTAYIFLVMNVDLMFSNFINNTVLYKGGSIYTAQLDDNTLTCGVSWCSFIENYADYQFLSIAKGGFIVSDCYIDNIIYNGGIVTNIAEKQQTIVFSLYNTRECQTGKIYYLEESSTRPEPTTSDESSSGDEAIRIAAISVSCGAAVGVTGVLIWAVKRVFKKTTKKALKKLMTDDEYCEEEEEEESTEQEKHKNKKKHFISENITTTTTTSNSTSTSTTQLKPIFSNNRRNVTPPLTTATASDSILLHNSSLTKGSTSIENDIKVQRNDNDNEDEYNDSESVRIDLSSNDNSSDDSSYYYSDDSEYKTYETGTTATINSP